MTVHELQDLSPLIEASDFWADNPERQLWLRHEKGRIALATTQPSSLFADLLTCSSLEAPVLAISRPTVLVEWPSGRHRLFLPETWQNAAPYEGRPYVLGQYDCYTAVRDWMARERGIEMDFLSDSPERLVNQWLTDGVFVTNPELQRWERVIAPQAGDGILFSLSRRDEESPNRANHCGVYLGDGRFLHHFPNRASCFQEFDQRWRSWVVSYMRHKG